MFSEVKITSPPYDLVAFIFDFEALIGIIILECIPNNDEAQDTAEHDYQRNSNYSIFKDEDKILFTAPLTLKEPFFEKF